MTLSAIDNIKATKYARVYDQFGKLDAGMLATKQAMAASEIELPGVIKPELGDQVTILIDAAYDAFMTIFEELDKIIERECGGEEAQKSKRPLSAEDFQFIDDQFLKLASVFHLMVQMNATNVTEETHQWAVLIDAGKDAWSEARTRLEETGNLP